MRSIMVLSLVNKCYFALFAVTFQSPDQFMWAKNEGNGFENLLVLICSGHATEMGLR